LGSITFRVFVAQEYESMLVSAKIEKALSNTVHLRFIVFSYSMI
jgi:hypothetical protein